MSVTEERIKDFKDYVIKSIKKLPWITPSDIVSKSFYIGFTEFRFRDARAIAEKTKKDFFAQNPYKGI